MFDGINITIFWAFHNWVVNVNPGFLIPVYGCLIWEGTIKKYQIMTK